MLSFHVKFVQTDRQTDGRTDGRTDRQTNNGKTISLCEKKKKPAFSFSPTRTSKSFCQKTGYFSLF